MGLLKGFQVPANVTKILIFSQLEQKIIANFSLHIKLLDLSTEDSGYDVFYWFAQISASPPKSMLVMTGPVMIKLDCCVGLQHLGLAMTALRWIASQLEFEGRHAE